MSDERMSEKLTAVESALSSLCPAPTGVDRDRLMYLAGRAAAADSHDPRASWLWPLATAASLLVAATFATMWHARGEPVIVYRDRPVTAPEQPDMAIEEEVEVDDVAPYRESPANYLRLRRVVSIEGLDALPESVPAPQGETLRWGSGFDRTLAELLEG